MGLMDMLKTSDPMGKFYAAAEKSNIPQGGVTGAAFKAMFPHGLGNLAFGRDPEPMPPLESPEWTAFIADLASNMYVPATTKAGKGLMSGAGWDFARPAEGATFRSGKVRDTEIGFRVPSGDEPIDIYSVRTPQKKRGQGSAKEAMSSLVEYADQTGTPLSLAASPLDQKTSLEKLVRFYESLGFKPTGQTVNVMGDPVMLRNPQR